MSSKSSSTESKMNRRQPKNQLNWKPEQITDENLKYSYICIYTQFGDDNVIAEGIEIYSTHTAYDSTKRV